jgi:hypothetical protein
METTDFLKTIRNMRTIVVATIISCTVVMLVLIVMLVKASNDNGKNIYVVTDAGTFLAKRNDYGLRHDFEIKNHVRLFFQNLLEGDQYTFTKNVESALCLIDNVNGAKIYDQLQKGGFYELYKRENAHTKVTIDSIKLNMNEKPYKVKIWLRQSIYWSGYSKDIPYGAVMEVVEDNRSEKNPFGLLISNFYFIEYRISTDIRTPKDSIR